MPTVREHAAACRTASDTLRCATGESRNAALIAIAAALTERRADILAQNTEDMRSGRENGLRESLLDRLLLTERRITDMAAAVRQIADLPDPVGGIDQATTRPNGLQILRCRVPLGVVGVIYEARPNVTIDIAALCLKSGNACLLRGGREAIRSNRILCEIVRDALLSVGLPADAVCLVEDTNRETAVEMMGLRGALDVLIPRGGAGLIQTTVENAKVPVIETGVGNCHVYIDEEADLPMACRIIVNAKVSRPSVCNAAETLLVARPVAARFLPMAAEQLTARGVSLRGCPETVALLGSAVVPAAEEDWREEYGDLTLAVRVVSGLYEATAHIARYGSKHSEAIVTRNYFTARRFIDRVDAAAVYCNASTRFTDGGEFGLGAEIGISTQKLHVRGPMGLEALTTIKYAVYGEGQIRE